MKQYLLSVCYPADGVQPAPAALTKIMSDVMALQKENAGSGRLGFQRRPSPG